MDQLSGNLESLRLSAGERRGGLAKPEIAQTYLLKLPKSVPQFRLVAESIDGLVYGPLQHVMNGHSLYSHIQYVGTVARPSTGLTGDEHVSHENHLYLYVSSSFAALT